MTRFVVDSGAVLRLVETSAEVSSALSPETGRELRAQVGRLPIRLLGAT
ncbi:hypothetical protein [Oerskovia sp. USHLN155]